MNHVLIAQASIIYATVLRHAPGILLAIIPILFLIFVAYCLGSSSMQPDRMLYKWAIKQHYFITLNSKLQPSLDIYFMYSRIKLMVLLSLEHFTGVFLQSHSHGVKNE